MKYGMEIDKPRINLLDERLALNGWADFADDYAPSCGVDTPIPRDFNAY